MGGIWFWLLVATLAAYVVLDGFGLGEGILHLWIARDAAGRRAAARSLGRAWYRNEVWLLAIGFTLAIAFPAVYEAVLGGFRAPLAIVLALLIVRVVSERLPDFEAGVRWSAACDICLAIASTLLVAMYGVLLGNVIRGVPIDARGRFLEPLWANFRPAGRTGMLDSYTILVGVTAVAALALHGATRLAGRAGGELTGRAVKYASSIWWAVALLTAVITVTSFRVLPRFVLSYRVRPWGFVFPVFAVAGLLGVKWFLHEWQLRPAFLASCVYLTAMIASVGSGLYPTVFPSSMNPVFGGLMASGATMTGSAVISKFVLWFVGIALAAGYTFLAHRRPTSATISTAEAEAPERA
ncbi:MAG TPA: cytochrome d ubiquinol oxidase subunit II [Candidatus Acidoferrales bacterium]|nr:cytochrome d ubiquinol oxidase subunit II [Candidatus Acidoferrales bacterium]